jgi:UDP-N-acetylmuramoyl-tripeptide--D-alanyl-D-alanine ligase
MDKTFLKNFLVFLLQWEAKAVIKKYKPKIVAITGSVGKTSTKDAVYAVISQRAHVRKSQKSFNSEIGLPLTILGVPNAWNNPFRWLQNLLDGLFLIIGRHRYPQWLVLEVGADRPGDIQSVAKWLKVDVAVITRLPEVMVHVEFFSSPQELIEEKASLITAIKPDGALALFSDDPQVKALAPRAGDKKVVLFGFGKKCDVCASKEKIIFQKGRGDFPIGMSTNITVDGATAPIEVVGAIGAHALLPALAAAAVGKTLGMDIADIVAGLQKYEPPQGRMHLIKGEKNTLIIDDTYNSSPAASIAALDALNLVTPRGGRRIAMLGDMLELGRLSVDEHRKVGAHAAKIADLLITVGFRARDIAQGALDNGMPDSLILQYEDSRRAAKELKNIIAEGDVILVKGSQSTRMERAVEEIMADPERAKDLLVRQDAEWKKR